MNDLAAAAERPRRRRRWWWTAAAALSALGVFVLVWFQPQKLFIDERVDDDIPVVAGRGAQVPTTVPPEPGTAGAPTTTVSTGPTEVARGRFASIDHHTSGVARVLTLADGSRIVRLEGLDTSNGPDLYLYLSTNPADGDEAAFDDDYVSLGRLKGNQGDQNYDLPAGTDLSRLATVVIWCDRFNSAFGAADLSLNARP